MGVILLSCNVNNLSCIEGRLPASAPLANPYVPFQLDDPPKYELQQALVRGTLFPGLEFPFMGLVNRKDLPITPATELQALAFGIQELALYLDTHADDEDAVALYRAYQKLYAEGQQKYEEMCGPINHMSVGTGAYQWLNSPWPWEYAANREG